MPAVVPDAEPLATQYRRDLGGQLLTRVGLRAKAAVVLQGRSVQAVRVPGGVLQLVQRRVRVGRLGVDWLRSGITTGSSFRLW